MTRPSTGNALRHLASALLVCVYAGVAFAQTPPPYVFSSPLLPLLLQMPENSWLPANANLYSDVWTPSSLEPLDNGSPQNPSKIIIPWSGFAWDSNRGDLILYGGGHANYPGNDVYRWHSSNLQWERASLPSEIQNDPVAGFLAIDGVDNAPISSHTYDNNLFLPIVDRFLTWGGATYNNGHFYVRVSETDPTTTRPIGPYLFDPNRADGNKVGGTTGSNVKRVLPGSITGGQMWQNRDIFLHIPAQPLPGSHINGCANATIEGGRDVVYTAASGLYGTVLSLYRYQLTDVNNPYLDQSSLVGAYAAGVSGQTTCGYDPVHKLFVRTGNNTTPFQFWDLTSPGPTNYDQTVQINASIAALQSWMTTRSVNIQNCGFKYDPTRVRFALWCGADVVWELTPPATGNSTSGWTATQRPAPVPPAPPGDIQSGVLGKWRYAPYFDVFVGLQGSNDGDIWIYKPVGWMQPNPPGNALPTVSVTSPPAGTDVAPATVVDLTATAADTDGSIARVEYYVNGIKVGQATSAPYAVNIAPILVGSYSVTAVAVDNVGGMTASAPVTFTVSATLTTSVLQRGLNGYAGASDTYLDGFAPTAARGALSPLYLDPATYRPLVRFAIFQSEGGPVPDGAVIQSAMLALYKQSYDDTLQLNPLLKPWSESQATWTISQTGVPWTVGGAAGAGTDYSTTTDALVTPSFNPGWVSFDMTSRVRQWASSGGNYGWRMVQTTGGSNLKQFTSSEYATDVTLRPKLTIVYSGGSSNVPPTVSITSPAPGAVITHGESFTVSANASDSDGTVTKVDFFANGALIGTDTTAPYLITWIPAATGSYSLTAVATDNSLATTTSAPVSVTVNPVGTGTTVVLQRGLNGYAGVSDTYLDNYLRTTVRGGNTPLLLDPVNYNLLLRFAIFQSEGGPVPNGATILSATLALYKQLYDDTLRLNALLKPWAENQATWTISQTGLPWTVGGAAGAGTDYSTTTDALVTPSWNPDWVSFDVTPRVQQWASSGANYGWRMAQAAGGSNSKKFNSSEYTTDATLRPKLTIIYSGGSSNVPPTVSLTGPADGASTTLGGNFAITATAGDVDGTVAKVEFLANGNVIGEATSAPYGMIWTPAAAGSYSLTARATDNLGSVTTSSNSATVSVTSATTTAVTSSLNPSTLGVSVTLTATVTGSAPSGTVGFTNNGSAIAGCTAQAVSAGKATCITAALAVGSHSIVATYSGDTNNNGSTSATLTQTVNKAASSTTLASSVNPSALGASVTFTATVTGNAPIGTVGFTDSGSAITGCTAQAVSAGKATCTTSALTAGSHSIVATYAGDANNSGSTSAPLTQTVNGKSATTTTLAASPNPSTLGQSVTFTATVTGSAPTGTAGFTDNGSAITGCTAQAISAGTATCTTAALVVGSHSIVATYGGDANNNGSTSLTLTQMVSAPTSFVNPGFEVPALGSGSQYDPTGTGVGWTFVFTAGIQGNGSNWAVAPAPEGTQTAFIQNLGSFGQSVTLNAGSYTLTFQIARAPCCTGPIVQPIRVSVDGVQIGALISPPSKQFTLVSVQFSLATTGVHTITFAGTDGTGDRTALIDKVTLN